MEVVRATQGMKQERDPFNADDGKGGLSRNEDEERSAKAEAWPRVVSDVFNNVPMNLLRSRAKAIKCIRNAISLQNNKIP